MICLTHDILRNNFKLFLIRSHRKLKSSFGETNILNCIELHGLLNQTFIKTNSPSTWMNFAFQLISPSPSRSHTHTHTLAHTPLFNLYICLNCIRAECSLKRSGHKFDVIGDLISLEVSEKKGTWWRLILKRADQASTVQRNGWYYSLTHRMCLFVCLLYAKDVQTIDVIVKHIKPTRIGSQESI